MEIDIHLELFALVLPKDSILGRNYSRVKPGGRELVLPVQVATVSVEAPVSTGHAIRIQAWYHLENVVLE